MAPDFLVAAKVALRNFTAPTDDANFYPPKFKGWVGRPKSPTGKTHNLQRIMNSHSREDFVGSS